MRTYDKQKAQIMSDSMRSIGIEIEEQANVKKIERRDDEMLSVTYEIENVSTIETREGQVVVDEDMETKVRHVFAIGDVAYGSPKTFCSAIQDGEKLAQRLFGD